MATASIDTNELETVVGWLVSGSARKSKGLEFLNSVRAKNGKPAVSSLPGPAHNDARASIDAVLADVNAAT